MQQHTCFERRVSCGRCPDPPTQPYLGHDWVAHVPKGDQVLRDGHSRLLCITLPALSRSCRARRLAARRRRGLRLHKEHRSHQATAYNMALALVVRL
jgi:hypothetical protein